MAAPIPSAGQRVAAGCVGDRADRHGDQPGGQFEGARRLGEGRLVAGCLQQPVGQGQPGVGHGVGQPGPGEDIARWSGKRRSGSKTTCRAGGGGPAFLPGKDLAAGG